MFKSNVPEQDHKPVANEAEDALAQPPILQMNKVATPEARTKAGTISCIGSGMSIVGTIECIGSAQVFGRVEGELRASDLLICEGAQLVGSVIAQEVTVCGRVTGTIRAVRVKLQSGGAVEGDIFHRSLSIDEDCLFDGSSKRLEDPTGISSNVSGKGPQKTDLQAQPPAPATLSSNDAHVQRH